MNKDKKVNNKADFKKQILMAALQLFSQKGYTATTVREIVEAAGTTAPSLYHHFGNKEGLYREMMKTHMAKIDLALESQYDDSVSAKTNLKNVIDKIFLSVIESRDFFRFMFNIYYGPPMGTPAFDIDNYHVKINRYIKEMITIGIRSKEFKSGNQNAMSWAIRGALQLAINEQAKNDSVKRLDREGLQRVLDFLLEKFET